MEVLDLVKRTLPVASAAAQFASKVIKPVDSFATGRDSVDSAPSDANTAGPSPSDASSAGPAYNDTNLTHYATVETEHPYKQATVSHFRVRAVSTGQPR